MSPLECPLLVRRAACGYRADQPHLCQKCGEDRSLDRIPLRKWAAPVVNPPGVGSAGGHRVVVTSEFNDADKIYYTTDGSDPTLDSPIYNWVA